MFINSYVENSWFFKNNLNFLQFICLILVNQNIHNGGLLWFISGQNFDFRVVLTFLIYDCMVISDTFAFNIALPF